MDKPKKIDLDQISILQKRLMTIPEKHQAKYIFYFFFYNYKH